MGTQSAARVGERRRALSRRERELTTLAARQHGVISLGQLLAAGLSTRTVRRRVEAGRLCPVHRGVYLIGAGPLGIRGVWMAAVLACGKEALLSHRSAAALWGLQRPDPALVEVTSASTRTRPGIVVHQGGIGVADRTAVTGIPVTSVARTLFDLAEVVDADRLERAFEEADRLRLLALRELEELCARSPGRRALRPVRRLIDAAREPSTTRSSLEDRFLAFCREHEIPLPATNVTVLGHEVDAFWPAQRLIVEVDGFGFHGHRAAFERDRARDAARQAAGYRVLRLTHRRLEQDAAALAAELRQLLAG
jgi:predicted transcriptional regulator of viral defense system